MSFVSVRAPGSEEEVELPTKDDSLYVTVLERAFPGAVGLKYRNGPTGTTRGLLMDKAGSVFYPPADGWGGKVFTTVTNHALPATTSAQSPVGAPSRKRQRTEELFEDSRVVDAELFNRVRKYIYFYKPDNFKRCVTPLTERFAAIVRHGANASLKVGDPVIIHSYFNDDFEAPSKVEKIVENLDTIILHLDVGARNLCDKNIIDFSTLCEGTPYLMTGFSVFHSQSSHLSLSAGIIASRMTSRLRFLGTSGSFDGDSGGACWSVHGDLLGMQCETENVPLVTGPNGQRMARATGGRCGIIPITYIYEHILGMLPPEPVVYIEE